MCDHPPKQSEEKRKVYIHFFFLLTFCFLACFFWRLARSLCIPLRSDIISSFSIAENVSFLDIYLYRFDSFDLEKKGLIPVKWKFV